MSSRYNIDTTFNHFRLRNSILRGAFVYGLILAMVFPGVEAIAYNYIIKSGGGGGTEKDAVIHYYNGTEWTTAVLAMEAEADKTDSIANSPLFYHNGIMWVKTDMYESDVAGTRVTKVNLPLEELAGKPDIPAGGLAGEMLKEPIKSTSKETAAGNTVPVLDQPSSKLEKNIGSAPVIAPVKTAPTVSEPVTKKKEEEPISISTVNKSVASTPTVSKEPVTVKQPVVINEKPVSVPVVVKTLVTSAPVKTNAPSTINSEPVFKPTDKTATVPVAEKPATTTTPAPKPKPVIEYSNAPVTNPNPNKPIDITSAPKPLVKKEPVNQDILPSYSIGSKPVAVDKQVNTPSTNINPKPTTNKPALDPQVNPLAKTDAKPIVAPTPGYVNAPKTTAAAIEPIPLVKPASKPATQPTLGPSPKTDAKPLAPANTDYLNTASKPAISFVPTPLVKPSAKPVTQPTLGPSVKADAKPILHSAHDQMPTTTKSAMVLAPTPLLKPTSKPVTVNYNLTPPASELIVSTFALKPERGPAPPVPSNFVFALGNKHGNIVAQVDTPKPSSVLTDFIKNAPKEVQPVLEETVKQEPKKEEPKKEEPKKEDKKKKGDDAPVNTAITLDTLKKIIQEEVNNAVGGKLPISATVAPAPKEDTATVELPPLPTYTVNDSIEELRKLNAQLQVELSEKLMLRDKLEDQVDQQRQIKKEAKLGGDLGKMDTIKLDDESYVVREYKFALQNEIFGWHPHWMGDSYRKYDYSLLTTLAYFSYELNPATGGYRSIHDWNTTEVIDLAQEKGCKVVLTATCLNEKDLSLFLANPAAQNNFVATIKDLVIQRNANGVNINFEKLNSRYRHEFVALLENLRKSFDKVNPEYQISVTIPAIDYASAYDVQAMVPFVDLFVMMGYEYTGGFSANTGPSAPLNGGAKYAQYNLGTSIDAYLKNKVPAEKLILAIPYYGVQWEVEGKEVPGVATKFIRSLSYSQIKAMFPDREPLFYEASLTPYYNTPIPGRYNMYEQVWFDNARSLGMKLDMIMDKKLGGVGIWALGMDGGNKEFWNVLEDKMLQIVPVAVDTITIRKAQSGPGMGSWFKSRFTRLINVLRRPSTYNPATSNLDNWLRMFMFIGGFTFIITRATFVIRRLQMGSRYKASKPYLYVLITSVAILSISMLMWARITRFFERSYESSSFLFTIGLILGIILAVIFILWILPKWLKNRELP